MYAQTLPFSNQILYNQPTKHPKKLDISTKLISGFCNSSKRVSESRFISRNRGHLATVVMSGASQVKQAEQCDDVFYMNRCVELARSAIGRTSPNPMVGCVIVKDGKIVGEGFHPKAGQPHAEVFALRDAGDLAENGIAYVSLEPCNHYGRTPPCTEALINAKVRKVVVGMVDPNPIVASTGVQKLRDAGIEVIVGVEEKLCKRLNEAYIHQMITGKPFVTLRYSMSLSGQILDQLGEEALNSGEYYSKLLQEYDAIVLSSTSLVEKSFYPVSNESGANQPHKIVLSKSENSHFDKIQSETGHEGIQRVFSGKISLVEILDHCKSQGFCSVLLDLMGDYGDFEDLLREGFDKDLFQKVVVEMLPLWGGSEVKGLNCKDLKVKVKNLKSRVSGGSILLEGYFS